MWSQIVAVVKTLVWWQGLGTKQSGGELTF